MKHIIKVSDLEPDRDPRSLRARVEEREKKVLRDTYYLVDQRKGPSRRITCGFTTVYPTGTTTGHTHDDMEECYYFISGEGIMVVGEDEFPIKTGDCVYVPPGEFHTTIQTGTQPLSFVWNTCLLDGDEKAKG